MQFYRPNDPENVTQPMGQNVVPVKVQDDGELIDGTLYYAYQVSARAYPQGTNPGQDIPSDAVELTLIDQTNHVWENVAVPHPQCSNSGSPNCVYVWAKYQKPGMPPVFKTVRAERAFRGMC